MDNRSLVNVADGFDDLFEDFLADVFFELAAFANVVEEISSSTHFHDEEDVFLGFEGFEQFHHVLMSKSFNYVDFLEHLCF